MLVISHFMMLAKGSHETIMAVIRHVLQKLRSYCMAPVEPTERVVYVYAVCIRGSRRAMACPSCLHANVHAVCIFTHAFMSHMLCSPLRVAGLRSSLVSYLLTL